MEKNIDKLNGNHLEQFCCTIQEFFFKCPLTKGEKRKNNRESLPPSPRKILFPWKVSAIPISLSSLKFGHLTGVSKATLKKKSFPESAYKCFSEMAVRNKSGKTISILHGKKKIKNNIEKQESIKQAEEMKRA